MKHIRLIFKLTAGLCWAVLVGLVGGYIVMSEEYQDAFEAWRA